MHDATHLLFLCSNCIRVFSKRQLAYIIGPKTCESGQDTCHNVVSCQITYFYTNGAAVSSVSGKHMCVGFPHGIGLLCRTFIVKNEKKKNELRKNDIQYVHNKNMK